MDAREFTNGMHLIPLDQDKEPTCGRGFLDEANYEQNTQKVIPGEMYGVLTGRPNRVLVIDWDCYGGKCEFELTEEMLTRKVGGEGAYIVKTRSGGYHTYFAWDEEDPTLRRRRRRRRSIDRRLPMGPPCLLAPC